MMLKKISSFFLLFILIFSLSSCSGRAQLLFLNWGEYIDEELLTVFENKYNCDVVMDLGDSNEIFYSKLRAGTTVYDVMCPSDYMVEKMYRNDMLLKIDFDKYNLEAYKNQEFIAPVKAIFDEMHENTKDVDKDGETIYDYAMPYLCGTWGIMYSTNILGLEDAVKNNDNSWSILFDRTKSPSGTKIAMYDSSIHAYFAACKYLENEGYDFNTHEELASSKLNQLKDLVRTMNFDAWGTDNIKKDIVAGNIDVGFMWTGDFLYYYCENTADRVIEIFQNNDATIEELIDVTDELLKPNGIYKKNSREYKIGFDLYIPDDTIAFSDNLVIPKDSSNPELAHKFIDFMISNSVIVDDVEYNPAFSNTYYVDYNAPYVKVYDDLVNLKYTDIDSKTILSFTKEDEELFKEELNSGLFVSETTLYSQIYDYATSISFTKYYDKNTVKGSILASFPRTYINNINTTFNNARA